MLGWDGVDWIGYSLVEYPHELCTFCQKTYQTQTVQKAIFGAIGGESTVDLLSVGISGYCITHIFRLTVKEKKTYAISGYFQVL